MTFILETERLRLRKFNIKDGEFVFTLLNSPGWIKFIGDRNIKSLAEAEYYITNSLISSYDRFGFGPYLVEIKDSGVCIGMCSLIKRDELEDVDIGFAFLDDYSGKGYAFEASSATLNYALHDLRIKKIVAITEPGNDRSIHLLKKLGLYEEKKVKFASEEEELLLFSSINN
jgi:RimJ/RimL family protein N-acetyltransferase